MELIKILKYFNAKKVLITGHTGFKGSWLSYLLDSHGAIVTGYSLPPNSDFSLFNSISFSNNFNSVIGDIRNENKFKKTIENSNPEFIFHLAAQPLVMESYKAPKETNEININGTLNLLEIIRERNKPVNVIFITTDKVYENKELSIPFVESDKLGGKDPYSASKAASEIIISSYKNSFFKNSLINIATARAGNVIGGGDWSNDRLIPDIIKSKIENNILIIRNPNAIRPWQHVLEPLFGYLRLGVSLDLNPQKFSSSWNFGPEIGDVKTVNEIINFSQKRKLIGEIIFQESQFYESQNLKLDISKSKKELGFNPKWKSNEALEKTFDWYENFLSQNLRSEELILNDIKSYLS